MAYFGQLKIFEYEIVISWYQELFLLLLIVKISFGCVERYTHFLKMYPEVTNTFVFLSFRQIIREYKIKEISQEILLMYFSLTEKFHLSYLDLDEEGFSVSTSGCVPHSLTRLLEVEWIIWRQGDRQQFAFLDWIEWG